MKAPYYPELDLDADGTRIKCGLKRNASMTRCVVRIEVFFLYGYYYMKKIVFRRADLKEYTIAERDFKYLYPSDFEDMYLLNLQEDFQLGIKSYQTQLNLTKPRWDATGFEFKHDFTVIDSSRAVTFWDKYGFKWIMRKRCRQTAGVHVCHREDTALRQGGESSETWKALLVEGQERETTDC
ncbi:hypothetical protein Tco_0565003 [Tanacetum coccineum]